MSSVDILGIGIIYPSNPSPNCAKPWYLGVEDWKSRVDNWEGNESRDDADNLQFNIKKSNSEDKKARFKIQAISGQNAVTETKQDELRGRGFMGTERDWKNAEVTFYAHINEKTNSDNNGGPHFEIEARSGEHTNNDGRECEDTALHTNVYPSGSQTGKGVESYEWVYRERSG